MPRLFQVLLCLQRNGTSGIKRYESKADTIVLYFDQIIGHTCVSLLVKPAFLVNDAKEANVKIYDYYQPEHSKSISYRLPSGTVWSLALQSPGRDLRSLFSV